MNILSEDALACFYRSAFEDGVDFMRSRVLELDNTVSDLRNQLENLQIENSILRQMMKTESDGLD